MTLFDRPYPFVHALGGLRRHLLFQPVAGGVQASDGDRHLVGDLPVAQVHLDQHAKRFLRRRDPRHPLPKRRQETRIRRPERSVERSVPFSLRIGGKARGQQVLLPYRGTRRRDAPSVPTVRRTARRSAGADASMRTPSSPRRGGAPAARTSSKSVSMTLPLLLRFCFSKETDPYPYTTNSFLSNPLSKSSQRPYPHEMRSSI